MLQGFWAGVLGLLCLQPCAADSFLEPERAFALSAQMVASGAAGEQKLELSYTMAAGYYLYREAFKFESSQARLNSPVLPAGKVKFDENFQKNVETYRDVLNIALPVAQPPTQPWVVHVTSQGCADQGLCYPPRTHELQITPRGAAPADVRVMTPEAIEAAQSLNPEKTPGRSQVFLPPSGGNLAQSDRSGGSDGKTPGRSQVFLPPSGGNLAQSDRSGGSLNTHSENVSTPQNENPDRFSQVLRTHHWGAVVALFFVAGLLLSLTPCVLPMLPILSALIAGERQTASRKRGLILALSYSLGMALVYTAFGLAAGLIGEGLAAYLQNPWVLSGFALSLILLALSMFDAYDVALPSRAATELNQLAQRLPAGRLAGVFVMGGVSALIVSPCVAAPLAGALLYLSQTRDVALGGMALFALAMGMSVPLLLLGISAGAWLPKAGAWTQSVKRFFGLLLLGVSLWTVQILLPPPLTLGLWGVLSVALGVLLLGRRRADLRPQSSLDWWRLTAAVMSIFWGVLQVLGAASGGRDPLQPLAHWRGGSDGKTPGRSQVFSPPSGDLAQSDRSGGTFKPVRSVQDLRRELQASGKPVMLDIYADWCVACKEMERETFADPRVQHRLRQVLLLRADVTAHNLQDRELLKSLGLFGPPGVLFWDATGREMTHARVVGYQNAEAFLQTLRQAFQP